MPYCKSCGAYIPDGDRFCVACGTAISSDAAASAAQTASAPTSDDLRETLEQKLKEQQEKAKEWAQHLNSSGAHSTSQSTGGTPTAQKPVSGLNPATKSKLISVLSYVGVGCFLPWIFAKDDERAKFHGKQGIVLLILSVIIDILSGMNSLAFILSIFRLYLMYIGIKNVFCNKMEYLPYIGRFAEKF